MEVGDAGGADLPRLAVAEFADDDYLRPAGPPAAARRSSQTSRLIGGYLFTGDLNRPM
jgi:hypothetical protein